MAGDPPAGSRHQLFRSFRQVLERAVTWELIARNPSDRIRNRRVKLDEDREKQPFTSWAEVEAIAAELSPLYRPLPVFLVGTGMRPEEALALEWKDIDKTAAVASIERVQSQGRTKPCKKSDRQQRRVPIRPFATWAIAAGVLLFYLSRIMGTSITQIDATYGHLVPDSEDYLRNLLDTYDAEVLSLAVEHAL